MSIKTIYTCDKCKNEQESQQQFWSVGIVANCPPSESSTYTITGLTIQVCRPCLDSFGIYVSEKKRKESGIVYPTIEDLFREILDICKD